MIDLPVWVTLIPFADSELRAAPVFIRILDIKTSYSGYQKFNGNF
jgi:hypothetical protein